MWAEAACAHYINTYNNGSNSVRTDWFKPEILRDLMRDYILTNTQIFNCLNSDIRSHQQLRVSLKNAYPEKSRDIDSIFNLYGF